MKVKFFLILSIFFINLFYCGNFEEILIFTLKIENNIFVFELHKDNNELNRILEIENNNNNNLFGMEIEQPKVEDELPSTLNRCTKFLTKKCNKNDKCSELCTSKNRIQFLNPNSKQSSLIKRRIQEK